MINLNSPQIKKLEIKYMKESLKGGWVSSGKFIKLFEKQISNFTGSSYAISCVNGTSALQLALNIAKAKEDTEVIIPSVSFIAAANSVIYNNASPIFMDVDKYLNIDTRKTIKFINENTYSRNGNTFNKKTKKKIVALIVVHVFGNAADIFPLKKICKKKNIILIEDAAESLGSFYKKKKRRHTGAVGDMGCLSFNANKIITTGGGGMILTNNKQIAKKAFFLSNQAKSDNIFFVHNKVGYNFRLPNINCAIGFAQFKYLKKFLYKKKLIHNYYKKNFNNKIKLMAPPNYCSSNYWMNVIKFSYKKNIINKAVDYFRNLKIETRPVWKLLYEQKEFTKFEKFEVYNAKKYISNCLCVPSSSNLKISNLKFIIKKISDFSKLYLK